MPKTTVIDLSHHNVVLKDFKQAKEAGVMGVIHKASQGGSFKDDKCEARWYLAKEAGMLWGLYHYLTDAPITMQMDNFLECAAKYGDKDTLLAIDHEEIKVGLSTLRQALEIVSGESGRAPVIYSGHVLKEQLGRSDAGDLAVYRLWLAQYGPKPVPPKGWEEPWLWQFTDKGSVPGIKPPTDCNAWGFNEARLVKEWAGLHPDQNPTPEPKPPVPQIAEVKVIAPANVKVSVEYI